MSISRKTAEETLTAHLESKGLEADTIKNILNNLRKDIKSAEKSEGKSEDNAKTEVAHGISCPRLMSKSGDLVAEF
jgi:hypothetical protein